MSHLSYFFIVFSMFFSFSFLQAVDETAAQKRLDEKYDIMLDNQYEDDTDIFAVPLDDSNEEDEEELRMLEKKSAEYKKK